MGEQQQVTSQLWKTGALTQSADFLRLVKTAAEQVDKTYSDSLVRHVAASPALLSKLVLPRGEGIDVALTALATGPDGGALDQIVLDAVRAHNTEENV